MRFSNLLLVFQKKITRKFVRYPWPKNKSKLLAFSEWKCILNFTARFQTMWNMPENLNGRKPRWAMMTKQRTIIGPSSEWNTLKILQNNWKFVQSFKTGTARMGLPKSLLAPPQLKSSLPQFAFSSWYYTEISWFKDPLRDGGAWKDVSSHYHFHTTSNISGS